ncbi:MAG TPA: MarR family winged helix-turn-helix transcriptional regulator [Jatrophihabitans sp.]|jgi:DNA-binding MarR family transcriptional regulator
MDTATRSRAEALARTVKYVHWQHHRALDARLRAVGSTVVQWDVLCALESDPSASGHDLAMATFQSDQALGVLTRRMEAKGLIERSVPHGRRFEHRVTAAGQYILDIGHSYADEIFEHSFSQLVDAEQATLAQLLQCVADTPGLPADRRAIRTEAPA